MLWELLMEGARSDKVRYGRDHWTTADQVMRGNSPSFSIICQPAKDCYGSDLIGRPVFPIC